VQRINHHGVVFDRFEGLANEPSLDHALFTRRGGVSRPPFATLNVGHTVGDDVSAVRVNHERALAVFGWREEDVVTAHLVHGARVHVVQPDDRGQVRPETDALVTARVGVVLMLRFADCVPVLFFDARRRVIGLAHVGWRGLPARVVPATVGTMIDVFGCDPAYIWAGVGPSIGPCCYEVGPEVVEQVAVAVDGHEPFQSVDGRVYLDLWTAVKGQLVDAGVGQIEMARTCTGCHTEDWFSHRAESGRTGRFGVVIGLRA
jgi:YfiH family protein